MKTKQITLIFSMIILAFAFIGGVIAQPEPLPFEQSKATGQVQYFIEFPKLDKAYINTDFYFYSHVNYGNGTHLIGITEDFIINTNLSCQLEGYAYNGLELFNQEMVFIDDKYFVYIPNATFQNEADGYYTVYCVDKYGIVGLNSNPFILLDERIVENKNFSFDLNKTNNIIMLIVILAIVILLVYLQKFLWAGIIIFLVGTMFIISGMNIILSAIVFFIGILVIMGSKGN